VVQERPTEFLLVYPVALVGAVDAGDVRELWRLLDGVSRTHGRVSVLLDVSGADGPVPDVPTVRPLAVPGAVVRAAVLGGGEWAAWATEWVGALVPPRTETFDVGEADHALRYSRAFPDEPPRDPLPCRRSTGAPSTAVYPLPPE
jgi:hypothetical protein